MEKSTGIQNDLRSDILRVILLSAAWLVFQSAFMAISSPAAAQEDKKPDTRAMTSAKAPEPEGGPNMPEDKMTLTSSAFADGEVIPTEHTCDGDDLSPPLAWHNVPAETRAFALICDDPDAPVGTWDHWVIFNLPGQTTALPAGVTVDMDLGAGVRHGMNSWKRTSYGGPCPPPGKPHRYFFRLYALSSPVDLPDKATKQELLKAIKPLTLAMTKLMGTYGR